ncbi:MAG: hypothetical protein L0H94_10445 [Nitrospira sp.]|nr:hypothetical protein [Nitrospira sp.]
MRSAMLALVLLLVSAAGCVMARDGNVKPPAQWPPHSNQHVKKSIAIHVIESGEQAVSSQDPDTAADFRIQAVKAYTESGLFSSVVTTGEPADLKADITLGREDDGLSWSGVASALTLTMIPGVVSQDVIANTTYTDRQQKVIGTIVKTEGLGSWVQFFLLFAMPFVDSPNAIMDKAQYDMHRATIEEAYRKGFF